MHREEVEEERALALGIQRQQLASQIRPATLVNMAQIRRLTAQTGAVVNDLQMDLASGVLDDGHDSERTQHTAPAAFRRWGSALALAVLSSACGSSSGDTGATAPSAGGGTAAGGTASGTGGAANAGAAGQAPGGGTSNAGQAGAGTAGAGMTAGSGGSGGSGTAGGTGVTGDWDPTPVGGDRPTKVYVPGGYVPGTPMPLVILLHGYSASGAIQEAFFQLKPQAEARGFLYAHPDGTPEPPPSGKKFWNATDACCDFGSPKIDDVAYLSGLVTEIATRWSVDDRPGI